VPPVAAVQDVLLHAQPPALEVRLLQREADLLEGPHEEVIYFMVEDGRDLDVLALVQVGDVRGFWNREL
jgi:hypothetical protein